MNSFQYNQVAREEAQFTVDRAVFLSSADEVLSGKKAEDFSGLTVRLVMDLTRDVVEHVDEYFPKQTKTEVMSVVNAIGAELVGNAVSYAMVAGALKNQVRYQLVNEIVELLGDIAVESALKDHPDKEIKKAAKSKMKAKYGEKFVKNALEELKSKAHVDLEDTKTLTQLAQNTMQRIVERSGMFEYGETLSKDVENILTTIQFSDRGLKRLERDRDMLADDAAKYQPLVCEPRPWTSVTDGGYYTEAFAMPLVNARGSRTEVAEYFSRLNNDSRFDRFREAVNEAQKTAFVVNKAAYRLAKAAFKTKEKILDIPQDEKITVENDSVFAPKYAEAIKAIDEAKAKKVKAAELESLEKAARMIYVEAKKADLAREGKRRACKAIIETAKACVNEDKLYFVYQADFRGRIYNVCSTLSTQGSDLSKGMLLFKEGKPLGDDGYFWLCVHAANVYGGDEALDKRSFADRVEFVKNNAELIRTVSEGNIKSQEFRDAIKKAENPVMFFAVCKELVSLIDKSDEERAKFISYIPVGMDGSCNGQQWAAGFLRSRDLAVNVNLNESNIFDTPNDLYRKVADGMVEFLNRPIMQVMADLNEKGEKLVKSDVKVLVQAYLEAELSIQRKICKRATMTEAYAVTPGGQRDMLLHDAPKEFKAQFTTSQIAIYKTVYGKALAYGLEKACMASRDSMDYFKSFARSMGEKDIYVTNPMGFTMRQAYKKVSNIVLTSAVAGSRIKAQYKVPSNDINTNKQESAIAPNITHSHDSAHMLMVVERMKDRNMSWLLVHDDYATHACEVTAMNRVIRETFVEIHKTNLLEVIKNQLIEQGADEGKIGIERSGEWKTDVLHNDFDLEEVLKSTYFFA